MKRKKKRRKNVLQNLSDDDVIVKIESGGLHIYCNTDLFFPTSNRMIKFYSCEDFDIDLMSCKGDERDKLQNQNEIAHDNLDESKRIELQMDRLTNQNQHLQLTETERQNKIIEYKQEKETLETELHDAIMKNQQLNKEYERNHYYQEMQKVKDQVQMMKMQNKKGSI